MPGWSASVNSAVPPPIEWATAQPPATSNARQTAVRSATMRWSVKVTSAGARLAPCARRSTASARNRSGESRSITGSHIRLTRPVPWTKRVVVPLPP